VAVDQLATDLGTEDRIRLPDMTFWHGKPARGHGLMRRMQRSGKARGCWTYRYRGPLSLGECMRLVERSKAPTMTTTRSGGRA
jgi:hypothetical protein